MSRQERTTAIETQRRALIGDAASDSDCLWILRHDSRDGLRIRSRTHWPTRALSCRPNVNLRKGEENLNAAARKLKFPSTGTTASLGRKKSCSDKRPVDSTSKRAETLFGMMPAGGFTWIYEASCMMSSDVAQCLGMLGWLHLWLHNACSAGWCNGASRCVLQLRCQQSVRMMEAGVRVGTVFLLLLLRLVHGFNSPVVLIPGTPACYTAPFK